MLLMNLEQRPVVFEDMGRQVLATGVRKRPEFFIQAIGKQTNSESINPMQKITSLKKIIIFLFFSFQKTQRKTTSWGWRAAC